MKFSFTPHIEKGSDLLVLPFWEGPKAAADYGPLEIGSAVHDFVGKSGDTAFCYDGKQRVLLLGLGKREGATVEALRRAYACAVKAAAGKKVKHISILFPKCKQQSEFLQGIGEGILLTNYSFTYKVDSLKESPVVLLEQVTWIGVEKKALLEKMETVAGGVRFVRDLVNGNADDKIERMVKVWNAPWAMRELGWI